MNPYVIFGLVGVLAVGFGLAWWFGTAKWIFGLGESKGEVDQRLRNAEGAVDAERDIAEIMVERRDTTETRKRLNDGTF